MTDESFILELRQLKADLGPAIPMRVRWSGVTHDRPIAAGLFGLFLAGGRRGWVRDPDPFLCLYPAGAAPGARPQVVVDVPSRPGLYEIDQGRPVDVHGIPQPGHAVVVVIDEDVYWPAYPARSRARALDCERPGDAWHGSESRNAQPVPHDCRCPCRSFL